MQSICTPFAEESLSVITFERMRRIALLLLFIPALLFAQNKDEELAAQYYLNGEFGKAALLYESLLKKTPSSTYLYTNYLNCLVALKDFEKADRMIRDQSRQFPSEPAYKVDRAWLQVKAGNPDKAKKMAEETVDDIRNEEQALAVALALIRRDFLPAAESAFLKGRKLADDSFLFSGDLSALYARMGKKEAMINEGIRYAQSNPANLEEVERIFQDNISEEQDWELLIKTLRQGIQRNPDDGASNELLMWTLVQKKDFYAAFVQFRALDKRRNEMGKRVMDLAIICLKNGDFDNAVRCYEYVVSLGENKPFYFQAEYGLLDVSYKRIAVYNRYKQQDVLDAVQAYQRFIDRYKQFSETEFAEKQLAQLYLFYLDRPDTAIRILENIVQNPRVKKAFKGEAKLDLGDAYLMIGEVWDAELYYSQVDKEFKEEPMGQEAKFRMARLFYYKGEFERAAAYLDVLKTATTQLISNNAIQLSLLIQDNTGLDTTEEPMKLYAASELLIFRNKTQEGLEKLDEIERLFPNHALQDEILMAKAKAMLRQNLPDSALHYLERIVSSHGADILADNALFMMAQICEYRLNQPERAMELYERVLLEYPSSLFAVEARKRFRFLRGDKPDTNENKQIMFDRFMN